MAIEVKAHLRYLPLAPRKVRLVADAIRGKQAEDALGALHFISKRAALPLAKLLKSAISNAEHNFKLRKDGLYIRSLLVNEGPILRRFLPRARGRATLLRRRRSHVTVVLSERQALPAPRDRAHGIKNDTPHGQ